MNDADEIISVRRLRSTRTSVESWDPERLAANARPVKHSMSDEASLGLRPVGEPSETTCSHRIRKRIRRDIVWQVAYGVPSEDLVAGSSPMTPYTH